MRPPPRCCPWTQCLHLRCHLLQPHLGVSPEKKVTPSTDGFQTAAKITLVPSTSHFFLSPCVWPPGQQGWQGRQNQCAKSIEKPSYCIADTSLLTFKLRPQNICRLWLQRPASKEPAVRYSGYLSHLISESLNYSRPCHLLYHNFLFCNVDLTRLSFSPSLRADSAPDFLGTRAALLLSHLPIAGISCARGDYLWEHPTRGPVSYRSSGLVEAQGLNGSGVF